MNRTKGLGALALLAASIVIAACAAPGAGSSNPPATTAAATTPPASSAAGLTLAIRTDAKYGAVVAGAGGMSLYVFANDSAGKSACTGDCAGTWPPLTVANASAVVPGSGVTGTLGTITRADGTLQVTLGGSPVYYYSGDAAAGDTNGQGLFNKWYLASAAGTPTAGAAPSPAASESPAASKCTSGPKCY
jgi:predicted lipoprotein with Yx(FWY)xxD motif